MFSLSAFDFNPKFRFYWDAYLLLIWFLKKVLVINVKYVHADDFVYLSDSISVSFFGQDNEQDSVQSNPGYNCDNAQNLNAKLSPATAKKQASIIVE